MIFMNMNESYKIDISLFDIEVVNPSPQFQYIMQNNDEMFYNSIVACMLMIVEGQMLLRMACVDFEEYTYMLKFYRWYMSIATLLQMSELENESPEQRDANHQTKSLLCDSIRIKFKRQHPDKKTEYDHDLTLSEKYHTIWIFTNCFLNNVVQETQRGSAIIYAERPINHIDFSETSFLNSNVDISQTTSNSTQIYSLIIGVQKREFIDLNLTTNKQYNFSINEMNNPPILYPIRREERSDTTIDKYLSNNKQ